MRNPRAAWLFALLLWICGGLQEGLSTRIQIGGGQPDFLLIAAVCGGLLLPGRGALIVGFIAGVIHGAIVGANQWQYILIKMLVAWAASLTIELRFQRNAAVAGLAVAVLTLVANILFMFLTSQADIAGFLKATIISAVYNGVVALLVYLPIERATGVTNH
jgi:cell shape-determining protein MreD